MKVIIKEIVTDKVKVKITREYSENDTLTSIRADILNDYPNVTECVIKFK